MTDYTVGIGGSTTLMIRDLGGIVEFWVQTGSQTWNNQQQWSFYANGSESGIRQYRMLRGGFWQKFGETYVGFDQDVRFSIYNAGLGFPTYHFWQHITRSTVPPAPTLQQAYAISATQIRVIFQGNGGGGLPILEWQIGYGSSPNAPSSLLTSGGLSDVGPFTSGQRVYFWTRGRNALGWSAWSNRLDASTWRVPDAPTAVVASSTRQQSVWTQFSPQYNGGTAIDELQLGYGLDPDAPEVLVTSSNGTNFISGLSAGKTYYLWARAHNSVGWGSWSERRQVTLLAGARVLVGTEWKRAVPYVRDGGVWKVAQPWVKNAGVWKETSA